MAIEWSIGTKYYRNEIGYKFLFEITRLTVLSARNKPSDFKLKKSTIDLIFNKCFAGCLNWVGHLNLLIKIKA